ncbi:MAG: zinc-dependent alcohol dehydrogenase family protein [Alphaproteobacteria bacterium]|mgnify:CR=1 FL=1|nr:zinc-dependent alcohol dehydrogenase family protein [Alphaproteobacteria bacterium]
MKAAQYSEIGHPPDVVTLVDDDPGTPGEGEVLIDVLASPINPSDLLMITGDYASRPELPASPGNEGLGRIAALGAGVDGLAIGDRVLLPRGGGTWRHQMRCQARMAQPVPADADPLQISMLVANPPTAALMLREYVTLETGDWVIQNAANSAVGRYLISLAAAQGVRTLNVVRRAGLEAELAVLGATAVIVDGPDLAARVAEATDGTAPRLGIDAVGGEATLRLADCLGEGGVVVNYGLLSGQPCQISPAATVFRDISLRGFWLARWFQQASREARRALYAELGALVASGELKAAVAATYPLEEIGQALTHAMADGRDGKVIITPAGEP